MESIEIRDLKDMLEKTGKIYGNRPAYKIRLSGINDENKKYLTISHKEVREMVNALGTSLIEMGLKNKRIAVIGENRYEWEIAYLAIACGTGIVVPLDKALPENELESLIERSGVEAIFCSKSYEEELSRIIRRGTGKLKRLISMDLKQHKEGVYSELELIENGKKLIKLGNRKFLDAKINPKAMNIMLFTSGTTSKSKVVALSHKNLCSNLMDIASVLDIDSSDRILSFLPLHHVFECTVGFLYSLYSGCQTSFCDGIRHILDNLREYKITFMSCVPAIYENIYKNMIKQFEKEGRLDEINALVEKYKDKSMEQKKKAFKEIHDFFGGHIKLLISGAASLSPKVEEFFRNCGLNLCQGYGLTETSPVIGVETNENFRVGSIGKPLPHIKAKLEDVNSEGIGELVVKGPSIMIGYFENEEATNEALKDGWFYTGDLAKIDKDGYIFICGRKKSVIVLKNGKNIFPEEMEGLINRIEGVKESFIFGKANKNNDDDIRINVKIVFDRQIMKEAYKVETDEEIFNALNSKIKEINKEMPSYKAIKKIILTEKPLIKTTTSKIKRQEELKTVL